MSYGQNLPSGLQATKCLGSATFNQQANPYLIQGDPNAAGATANSIFRGDPVALNAQGYIVSIYDISNVNYGTTAILGVFVGCSYQTSTATDPIDPASPGRKYWPTGTATLNNQPATAYIIDDPNVVFNIQSTGGAGLSQTNVGNTAPVIFTFTGAGAVDGNLQTGESKVALDQGSVGTGATNNLKILRIIDQAGNITAGIPTGVQYNNAEVIIQNHFLASRPAGV